MDTLQIRINKAYKALTTSELAKRAGCDRGTAWRWETGRLKVSPEMAERLTRVLIEPAGVQDVPAQKSA